jgi:signal recognition particle subunit SRP54
MITGKPVKFLGVGEKLEGLEEFRPEGMAQRILGMGDIVGLANEALTKFDADETAKLQAKMEKGTFTLDDFMSQMTQVRKLGSMGRVMGMIPGMSELSKQVGQNEGTIERSMNRMRAMYDSMTKAERKKPDVLDGPRRRRIAAGSGVAVNEVGQFVKQFEQTRDMMRAVTGGGAGGIMNKMKMMKGLMGGGGGIGMPGQGNPLLRTKRSGWQEPKDRNKKKRR